MRALIVILCLLAAPALADMAGVASVIDGDTLEIHGQRIRLHGIDATESRQLCRLNGKPWQCGKDAANALADKIARRPVTCEDLGRDLENILNLHFEDLGEQYVKNISKPIRRYAVEIVAQKIGNPDAFLRSAPTPSAASNSASTIASMKART